MSQKIQFSSNVNCFIGSAAHLSHEIGSCAIGHCGNISYIEYLYSSNYVAQLDCCAMKLSPFHSGDVHNRSHSFMLFGLYLDIYEWHFGILNIKNKNKCVLFRNKDDLIEPSKTDCREESNSKKKEKKNGNTKKKRFGSRPIFVIDWLILLRYCALVWVIFPRNW